MNNILITSAGRRVSLVRFFQKELKAQFPEAKVFTTDSNPDFSAACHVSDGAFEVPRVSHESYIGILLKICKDNGVRLIVPTIDTELRILADNISLFGDNGIAVSVPDSDMVAVFRDKRQTHLFFERYGIGFAREFSHENYELPLYIKPIDGSRSVDNYIVLEESELTDYHRTNPKLMFLEYLDHKKHTEFTIDIYYDLKGQLKCFIPRQRIEVRDGEVNKAVTRRREVLEDLKEKLREVKGFRGCITFQVFLNEESGKIYGIEINPRFGGGYPLSYLAGGNFPKWLIEEHFFQKEIAAFDGWEEDLMMLRYDDEVLVKNVKP